MKHKFLKKSWILASASSLIFALSGCGGESQSLKPWNANSIKRITFSFTDVNPAEGKVEGELNLRGAEAPAVVKKYAIYWGSSKSSSGQGRLLAKVAASGSGTPLYKVPADTTKRGEYFLLFLEDEKGNEIYSGKSTAVKDLIEKVQSVVEKQPDETGSDEPAETGDVAQPEIETPVDVDPSASVADGPEETDETGEDTDEATDTEYADTEDTVDTPDGVITTPDIPDVDSSDSDDSTQQLALIAIDNVLFDFDRSTLRQEFKENLYDKLSDVENKEEVRLLISGHADERGSNEYNLALGERRAHAVKLYLVSLGFLDENIITVSFGEEQPIDPAHNTQAWQANRRVETVTQD